MQITEKPATFCGLTLEELTQLGQTAWINQKKEMHAAGVPTTRVVNSTLYYEYPDGRLEKLKDLSERRPASDAAAQ